MTGDEEARWHVLPARIDPQDWATAQDVEPVPGAVLAAEEQRQGREIRRIAERGVS